MEATTLLRQWGSGDREALDRLMPLVYEEMRRLARQRLRSERLDHTLGTTALVHEAYLRLADIERAGFESRAHFLSMASRAMRRVLVDHARRRNAAKRGGGERPERWRDDVFASAADALRFLALEEALGRLERVDAWQAGIVEQHYFGGLTVGEIAELAGVSDSTVKRALRSARAWLAAELGADAGREAATVAEPDRP